MKQININYTEVYTKTAQMCNQLAVRLNDMDAQYRRIHSCLDRGVDGASAAALNSVMNENRRKAYKVAETLEKLLAFMTNAAKRVEAEERKIANVFSAR